MFFKSRLVRALSNSLFTRKQPRLDPSAEPDQQRAWGDLENRMQSQHISFAFLNRDSSYSAMTISQGIVVPSLPRSTSILGGYAPSRVDFRACDEHGALGSALGHVAFRARDLGAGGESRAAPAWQIGGCEFLDRLLEAGLLIRISLGDAAHAETFIPRDLEGFGGRWLASLDEWISRLH